MIFMILMLYYIQDVVYLTYGGAYMVMLNNDKIYVFIIDYLPFNDTVFKYLFKK